MATTVVEKDMCPSCGHILDAFSSINKDAVPQEGDLSICINCLAYLTISKDLTLQILEVEDFINLPNDVSIELMNARKQLSRLKSQIKHGK